MSAGVLINAMPRENQVAVVAHELSQEIHNYFGPFPCCPPSREPADESPLKLQGDSRFDPIHIDAAAH